jgi:predicted aspartyl protease
VKRALATTFLTFLAFAAFAEAETNGASIPSEESPLLTISVFDRASVPTEFLAAAEGEASRIFLQAGVETKWLNCSKPLAAGQSEATPCGTVGARHLVVEILHGANSQRLLFHSEVLGTATLTDKGQGFYCYLFYDRIKRLAGESRLYQRLLLGDVLAHETGHLILGSKSHSLVGIMSRNWRGDTLRRVFQRGLFFDPSESRIMRERLNANRAYVETLAGNGRSLLSRSPPSETPDQDSDSTTLNIEIESGFLVVARGQIQDLRDLKFIVDTGVTNTVVDRRLADKLRLRRSTGMVLGFEGFVPMQLATVGNLQLGPLQVRDLQVYIGDLPAFSALAKNVDGIVGMDVLASAKRFRIDYENRTLLLEPAQHFDHPQTTSKCFVVSANIQGTSARLLVDTGFPSILLYRNRLLKRLPDMRLGPSTKVEIGHLHFAQVELPQVQIGSGVTRTARVLLIDGPDSNLLPDVDGYLGTMSLCTKWVDFNVEQHVLSWQRLGTATSRVDGRANLGRDSKEIWRSLL